MLSTWFDTLGENNPQLLREWKGRLKPRNILWAIALSLALQGLLIFGFMSGLPGSVQPHHLQVKSYPLLFEQSEYRPHTDESESTEVMVIQSVYDSPVIGLDLPGWDEQELLNVLQPGDEIVTVDGQTIGNEYGAIDRLVRGSFHTISEPERSQWEPGQFIGDPIQMTVRRGTETLDIELPRVVLPLRTGSYCQYAASDSSQYRYEYRPDYCQILANSNDYLVDWQLWYQNIFVFLSWGAVMSVMIIGTFLILADLQQETQRGTLNFIRLSPRNATSIFIGKILGVPSLIYLAVGTAFPLHLWAGLHGGNSLLTLLAIDGCIVASWACFFSVAVLFGLTTSSLGGLQPWLGAAALFMGQIFLFNTLWFNSGYSIFSSWFILLHPMWPILALTDVYGFGTDGVAQYFYILIPLTLANFGLMTFWSWKAIYRVFHRPTTTVLSKQQSYWLVISLEIIALAMVGTFGYLDSMESSQNSSFFAVSAGDLIALHVLHFVLFVGLILMLSPRRQMIQDWARYRHVQPDSGDVQQSRKSLLWELVWSDRSPATVAIAINVCLMIGFSLLWMFAIPHDDAQVTWVLQLISMANWILIYATISQFILTLKGQRQSMYAFCSIGSLFIAQIVIVAVFGTSPTAHPSTWLLLFPWAFEGGASTAGLIMGLVGQCMAIALTNLQLSRQIHRLGTSNSQKTLAAAPAANG